MERNIYATSTVATLSFTMILRRPPLAFRLATLAAIVVDRS